VAVDRHLVAVDTVAVVEDEFNIELVGITVVVGMGFRRRFDDSLLVVDLAVKPNPRSTVTLTD